MRHPLSCPGKSAITTIGIALILSACSDLTTNSSARMYTQANLVADVAGLGAVNLDANLVNPWGVAFGPTGLLWVANNHTGTSTVYSADGTAQATVVLIPSSTSLTGGAPTGLIYNSTADFTIPALGAAQFIFAGEDGTISAWNTASITARRMVNRSSSSAVYKGIAIASNGGVNFLYATNFKQNAVDVFNTSFTFTSSFTDPSLPAGYAPFGIQNIGGKLYVTFAKQLAPDNEDDDPGVGNGYVVVFNTDGTISSHFASTGTLNSPWAVVQAPSTGFGAFSGDLLIGNFGDGLIGAYNPTSGHFDGFLRTTGNTPITIDGLWGLAFGTGANSTTLYFTAGPTDETHGLLGTLKPR